MIACDEKYGADFAAAGLLLSPGIAQMYTTGEIAAKLCLEKPGLDTLDIAGALEGHPDHRLDPDDPFNAAQADWPTSSRTTTCRSTPRRATTQLVIPGSTSTALALPWGGTSHPVWFKHDPRVANVKALGGVFNRALMQGVPQIVAAAIEATAGHGARREVRRSRGRRPPR